MYLISSSTDSNLSTEYSHFSLAAVLWEQEIPFNSVTGYPLHFSKGETESERAQTVKAFLEKQARGDSKFLSRLV